MNRKTGGILALLGLAGGAFAYWKYRNLSAEEKAQLKSKVNTVGRKIKATASDVEETITDSFTSGKQKVRKEYNNTTS